MNLLPDIFVGFKLAAQFVCIFFAFKIILLKNTPTMPYVFFAFAFFLMLVGRLNTQFQFLTTNEHDLVSIGISICLMIGLGYIYHLLKEKNPWTKK